MTFQSEGPNSEPYNVRYVGLFHLLMPNPQVYFIYIYFILYFEHFYKIVYTQFM